MKRYSIKFNYPECRDNEYRLNACSEKSAVGKAVDWHMKLVEDQGYVVWEDCDSNDPHFLASLGINVSTLPV